MDNACTIGTPCHENWNCMTPNAEGRHCAACNLTVIDLTRLSPQARVTAMGTIRQRIIAGERVCVRGNLNRDGMLAGSRRVLTGGMALMLAMTIAGCTGEGIPVTPQPPAHGSQPTDPKPTPMGTTLPLAGAVCAPPLKGEAVAPAPPARPDMGRIALPRPATPPNPDNNG